MQAFLKPILAVTVGAVSLTFGTYASFGADGARYRNPNAINLTVTVDFAEIVHIDQPAATVIIGNSGVLDANMAIPDMMVLTGKAPGVTNLVVVNQNGDHTIEYLVEVVPSRRKLTTVHQGAKIQTYQCGVDCRPVLSIGDSQEHFDAAKSQIESRSKFSEIDGNASAPLVNHPMLNQ